jgi:hypothetical protein
VAYRQVSKRWLCKQRPLLGNVRNKHVRNARTTVLCNPFLSNRSVNTPLQQYLLLEKCVLYKEDNWSNSVEGRGFAVQLSSARGAEKTWRYSWADSWQELHGRLWLEDLSEWSWRISTVRSRCQGTAEDTAGSEKAYRVLWWFIKYGDQQQRCNYL